MRPTAFLDARVIDPSQDLDDQRTLLVHGGIVHAIEGHIAPSLLEEEYDLIDCRDKVLFPGLVDMQVRTGEPGREHEETLESASLAAASGGVTSMVTMPDTLPVIDDIALVDFILRNASATAANKVHVMGGLTKGLKGVEMSELRLMHDAGAAAFTNGRNGVQNSLLMRRALSYARDFDGLIVNHVEDLTLVGNGVMNEGEVASRLGLPGIPKTAEIIMLERDIRLVELTGGRYHAAAISCSESVEIIRQAKDRGLDISCGVSINNLSLNETDIGSYRTFFKLNPPLRREEDRLALVEALKDGTIDIVHSDHDPKDVEMKRHPFADCADGAIGLETLLPAALRLYHNGDLALSRLVETVSSNPARRLKLDSGTLQKGAPADLVLVDLDEPWILTENTLRSRSKNTTFEGARFSGRPIATYIDGIDMSQKSTF